MSRSIVIAGAVVALSAASAAQAAGVEVKDAVARVVISPEARSDVQVQILANHPDLPLKVRRQGDRVIVDGGRARGIRNCRGSGAGASVSVSGVGEVAYAALPQVLIRTPLDAEVSASGAVFGAVGRSRSLTLAAAGCGDWVIANVEGKMSLSQAGSGDVRAGRSGGADLRLTGSGDMSLAEVAGSARISIAGSGGVDVTEVRGQRLDIRIAGSGDAEIDGGTVDAVTINIAGSGDASFDGTAASADVSIAGSGDVELDRVTGQVKRSILGSGTVSVERAS